MKWEKLPLACRAYLLRTYAAAIPVAVLYFYSNGSYIWSWYALTVASLFVAVIHLNLPELPAVVISMSDVFTFLALLEFGAGPALITYWANVIATAFARHAAHSGLLRKNPRKRAVAFQSLMHTLEATKIPAVKSAFVGRSLVVNELRNEILDNSKKTLRAIVIDGAPGPGKPKVMALIDFGLRSTRGNYKTMAAKFRLKEKDYRRFMDFLRRSECLLDFRPYRMRTTSES